ncbi:MULTISPECIES: hypothetical protein [unclassified Streptomyces]|uniref:hypothetical protein n=1 Tax=unclassified Streptomyces TaxID=2593676 RepID=UPI00136F9689|nr:MULTISPECIES: hypothetical protein [unclassified Streptomyces]
MPSVPLPFPPDPVPAAGFPAVDAGGGGSGDDAVADGSPGDGFVPGRDGVDGAFGAFRGSTVVPPGTTLAAGRPADASV